MMHYMYLKAEMSPEKIECSFILIVSKPVI